MNKNTKIIIGIAVLIVGALVAYFMMNRKGSTTTSTTTSSGIHGLDLGGILGSLKNTGTKPKETVDAEENIFDEWRTGSQSSMNVAHRAIV